MKVFTKEQVLEILKDSDHLDDARMALESESTELTRLVVVSDKAGRIIDQRFDEITLSLQDDNRTLKVFVKRENEKKTRIIEGGIDVTDGRFFGPGGGF